MHSPIDNLPFYQSEFYLGADGHPLEILAHGVREEAILFVAPVEAHLGSEQACRDTDTDRGVAKLPIMRHF